MFAPRVSVYFRTVAVPVALLSALVLSGQAVASQVKGKLAGLEKLVPEVYQEAARVDSHRYTWRESTAARPLAANPSREVCVAAVAATATGGLPLEPQTVRVTGGRTIPTTLVVSPGTRISFVNRDPFPHRLFIPGNVAWRADSMNPASTREWTAPAGEGRFEFRDELFPSVRTFVVVDPAVVKVAFPAHDGAFQFENLPAGEYMLKVFFGGKSVGQASIAVKDKMTLDLRDVINVAGAAAPAAPATVGDSK